MPQSGTPTKKVQAILRMDPDTFDSIHRAARRSKRSFNTFAIEALEAAVGLEKKIRLSEIRLDPVLESYILPSSGLTEKEIREDPRLSAILGL